MANHMLKVLYKVLGVGNDCNNVHRQFCKRFLNSKFVDGKKKTENINNMTINLKHTRYPSVLNVTHGLFIDV